MRQLFRRRREVPDVFRPEHGAKIMDQDRYRLAALGLLMNDRQFGRQKKLAEKISAQGIYTFGIPVYRHDLKYAEHGAAVCRH